MVKSKYAQQRTKLLLELKVLMKEGACKSEQLVIKDNLEKLQKSSVLSCVFACTVPPMQLYD